MGAGSGGGAASKIVKVLAAAGAMGLAAVGGYTLSDYNDRTKPVTQAASVPAQVPWVASAPGRVDAKSGEIRIGAAVLGRIAQVDVSMNDRVEQGEVLIRLEDDEARARLVAAEAEAGARQRERDAQPATSGRDDVRKAEDAVYLAERAVTGAGYELDAARLAKRRNSGNDRQVTDARTRLTDARERLRREQLALATAQSRSGVPAPNRLESALVAARTQVSLAQLLFDRTRIRAPIDGTVLQVFGKAGEMVAPSAEQPLITVADPAVVIVTAEVDARDISKIKIGQRVIVRSTAFPDRDVEGKVTRLAPALGSPHMSARGPRRPTDHEVLEVTVEFENAVPLIPGLRVDTFFRRES